MVELEKVLSPFPKLGLKWCLAGAILELTENCLKYLQVFQACMMVVVSLENELREVSLSFLSSLWEMIKKLFAGNLLSCFRQLHYWAQPSQLCIPKLGWFRFECVRILRTRQNLPITSVHGVYLRYKITFQSCLSFWPGSGI